MIYNRQRLAKKKQLTWVINERLPFSAFSKSNKFGASFVSNGRRFYGIITVTEQGDDVLGYFDTAEMYAFYQIYRQSFISAGSWTDRAYRTITFDEEPSGSLLTWLEANATPQ